MRKFKTLDEFIDWWFADDCGNQMSWKEYLKLTPVPCPYCGDEITYTVNVTDHKHVWAVPKEFAQECRERAAQIERPHK